MCLWTRRGDIKVRDPNRIDLILKQLGDIWKQMPDWRLGQLFCNLQRCEDADLFFYEDQELIDRLKANFGS